MRLHRFGPEERRLFLSAVIALCVFHLSVAETRYDGDEVLEVKVEDSLSPVIDAIHELGPKIEIWHQPTPTTAHVYVPRSLTTAFRRRLDHIGATYRSLIDDVQRLIDEERESNAIAASGKGLTGHRKRSIHQFPSSDIVGIYPTYEQLIAWLTEMSQRYASVCTLYRLGHTFENRYIYVIKIFDSSATTVRRPAIWIDAGIHAREWIAVSSAVYLIDQLLKSFSSRSGDWSTIRHLDWYVAPLLNPDGYAYSHHPDGDRFWRKNRAYYNATISFSRQFNRTCLGIDLNRNFDYQWGTVFANEEPCYIVYGGPFPASELETRAVMPFFLRRRHSVAAFLTFHSYGQMLMTRWAYTDQLYLPEHNETMKLLLNMADAIYQTDGFNYSCGTAPELLYKFSGGFGDWARGVAGVKYAIEVELRDRGNLGFVLPVSHIRPVGEEMWSAVRVLARHIVEEKREEYMALTTPGLRTSSFQNSHGVGVIIYRTRTEMLLILGVCAAAILLNLATERLRLTVRVDSSAFVPASDSSS